MLEVGKFLDTVPAAYGAGPGVRLTETQYIY
jgi:hypothetical protein